MRTRALTRFPVPATRPALAVLTVLALLLVGLIGPSSAEADATWVRVQFDGAITDTDRQALADLGLVDVYYAPADSYITFADAADAVSLAQINGVKSVRAVTAAEKIDADLRDERGLVTVQVLHHGAASPQATQTHAQFPLSGGDAKMRGSVLTVQDSRIAELAADPTVLHIGLTALMPQAEDEGTAQILAGKGPVPGYSETLADLGVDGSGVTIAVVDTGVDEQHPDLDDRVVGYADDGGFLGFSEPNDAGGHGTHVAGIIAGTGDALPAYGNVTDGSGLRYGMGVAPGAGLIDYPYLGTLTGLPSGGYPALTRQLVALDAVAWNASWTDGGGVGAGYNANAAIMDTIVRDADLQTSELDPFTLVFSAGNSGSGNGQTSRITSPKEAKNIIAVGGTVGQRVGNPDTMYSSSSRGPAIDGRVVPTVLAPAQGISSARSFAGSSCGTSPYLGTRPSVLHSACSGTSMASPHVAGAVALITEWWRNSHEGATPSPALVKALLINTATDIQSADIPNRDEGWGRVNVGAALDGDATRIYVDQDVLLGGLGQGHTVTFTAADPTKPVRATLVWTDAPGLPEATFALVNDLDLTLSSPTGVTYRGNNFAGGVVVPGGTADRLNNVENIYLAAGEDGAYTLSVRAANLPGDGVPQNGDQTDQDFALIIDNAIAG